MIEPERICEATIACADLGFMVLPLWSAHDGHCDCGKADCQSPGKHPHGRYAPHGLKGATRDKAVIRSWFRDGQLVNIGIRTGPESGLLVLDVDPRHAGNESLKNLGPLPDTATVETGGGGRHLHFTYPDGLNIRNSAGKLGPGLDIRGAGGYVVAPPSLHVSGGVYKWLRDPRGGLADLPQQILARLIGKPASAKATALINGIIPKGQRDDTLTSTAGTMRRRGMTEKAILAALREENQCCEEPLPDADLHRIARSIGRKEPGQPIRSPESAPLHLELAVAFPVTGLPDPVDKFVMDAARAIGCDPSYVALPLLAGLAAAIGNTRRIHLKHSWNEPAIVWGAIVGDSGTLKSPALEVALRPIRRRQHAAMKQFAEAMEAYKVQLMEYEKQLAAWKRSSEGGERPVKTEEPVAVRCWCDDSTIEALAVLLQQNPRGLLLVRDELAGWLGSFDRYNQGRGADAAKWLEMFGGRSIMVDRKSGQSKTIYVQRAAVSVTGGIQPETLRRALGAEHRENGLDESDEQRDQRRLIEVIQRKGGSVTVRNLIRSTRMFGNAEAAERGLDELGKAGYGRWEDPPPAPAGGQPIRRFILNPAVDVDETPNSSVLSGVMSTSTGSTQISDGYEQQERAAILEFDGKLPRAVAEERACTTESRVSKETE
jgi:hypothetical protein